MGRTKFTCSYPGCKSCPPNMRFNIERHIWTQHVRRNVPGMDQVNYIARHHKSYIDQYVVMAEETHSFLGSYSDHSNINDHSVSRSITGHDSVSLPTGSVNGCDGFWNHCNYASLIDDVDPDFNLPFDRLVPGVFPGNTIENIGHHVDVKGITTEKGQDFEASNLCYRGSLPDIISAPDIMCRNRIWGPDVSLTIPRGTNNATVQQPISLEAENLVGKPSGVFGKGSGYCPSPNSDPFANLHPSKTLTGIDSLADPSLVDSICKSTEANSSANDVGSLINVAVSQLCQNDQQKLYDTNARFKLPTARDWTNDFNYYLGIANSQDVSNSDVWRPVNF